MTWQLYRPGSQPAGCAAPALLLFKFKLHRTGLQVIELDPGVDSRAVWHEARLMRRCVHDRIVPLYGIAIKV